MNETMIKLQTRAALLRDCGYHSNDELADDLAECVRLIIALLEENAAELNAFRSAFYAPGGLQKHLTDHAYNDILRNEVGPKPIKEKQRNE